MKFIFIFVLSLMSIKSLAFNDNIICENNSSRASLISVIDIDTNNNHKLTKTKIIAVTLAVTLGVFGVHRLYLGTKPIVPIAYTLTLGGGIILPIIDIVYILSAKDINQIKNNDFLFMWNKKLITTP